MATFKQIREAAKYNPYAIGMAAAKKAAGITDKTAEDLPKAVITKGHEIAKKIKANESFDAVLETLQLEIELESYTFEEIQDFMASDDFEQLDELSKGTLANYAQKAAHDVGSKMYRAGGMGVTAAVKNQDGNTPLGNYYNKERAKSQSKALTRLQGIKTAAKKLAKEEFEDYSLEEIQDFMQTEDYDQLDELSKKTLGSYVKKATDDYTNRETRISRALDNSSKMFLDPNINKAAVKQTNRKIGMNKAIDKLVGAK